MQEPPTFSKKSRLNRMQLKGKTYERRVIREVEALLAEGELYGELKAGPWLEFVDRHGEGICQPDLVLIGKKTILIIEAKLKQSPRSFIQLNALYGPLLQEMYPDKRVLLLEAFKYPRRTKTHRWVEGPKELIDSPRSQVHHWHLFL